MLNIFPISCNVNFETVIYALNTTKRTENVTLDDIGNILLVNLPRQNLKSGGLNLYKMCLTIKNFWMDLRLPHNEQFSTRTLRWDSVLEFFNWCYDYTQDVAVKFSVFIRLIDFLLVINDLTLAYQHYAYGINGTAFKLICPV